MARQVLPIAGAIIGGYFGGPQGAQIGFAIGSVIGNAVDPLKVRIPGIKDIPTQDSGEGGFRQVVYGTCWVNSTNLIDFSDVRRVTQRERQGKGGGPVVESERLYRTYAIGLGEPMAAIRVIRRDGKIVYDVRPGSSILSDSAAYADRFRFYTGSETQTPDPDLEAIHGVGNTPSYRGTAYLVFPNDDLTDTQGRIPTYEVEALYQSTPPGITGSWFAGPVAENGAAGGSQLFYAKADEPEDLPLATPTALPAEMSGSLTKISVANRKLFFHAASLGAMSTDGGASWTALNVPLSSTERVYWNGNYYYNGTLRSSDGITWATTPNLPSGTDYVVAKDYQNTIVALINGSSAGSAQVSVSYDDGGNWVNYPPSHFASFSIAYIRPGNIENWQFSLNSTLAHYTNDDFASYSSSVLSGGSSNPSNGFYSGQVDGLWIRKGPTDLFRSVNDGANYASVLSIATGTDTDDSVVFGGVKWAAFRYVSASPSRRYVNVSDNDAQNGTWIEGATPIYGSANSIAFVQDPDAETLDAESTTLAYVLEDISDRCGLSTSEIDISPLDAVVVDGVTLGGGYTGADAAMLFMPAYFFDLTQPDKTLDAVVRGGASAAAVTADNFVEEPDENILRGQDIEYPRQIMLKYLNPGQNYAAPAAVVSRASPDIRVRGEAGVELPISFDETGAIQVADRMLKVMWEDLNGEITFSLPSGPFAWLAPTDILTLSLRGGVYRIRVEKIEEAAGVLKVTARRDRQSAYTSNLTAPTLPTPTAPPPAQPGATDFVVMNLPALTDAEDALGVYIAMTGEAGTAWNGAQVAYRVQGATEWTVIGSYTTRAVMGEITAGLGAASPYYTDTTNSIAVQLVLTTDELETITQNEFLSEGNPAVIVYPDYTGEVIQFRDVVDDSDGAWTLSTLQRGRLNTDSDAHLSGARFAMLDGAVFLPLPTAVIGQTLEFRVTSLGTSPETAPTQTLVWNPVLSQHEFPPAFLSLERAGGVISGSWSPRHRFGTDVIPVASLNFTGYQVTLTDSTTTNTFTVLDPEFSVSDAAYSGAITVSVAQLNRYTGAGPSISEAI